MPPRNTEPCIACDGGDDEGEVLLCDGCNGAYHAHCVCFKGPLERDWLCPSCEELYEAQPPAPSWEGALE